MSLHRRIAAGASPPTTPPAMRCAGWVSGSSRSASRRSGVDRVELEGEDECCGFGGLFSIEAPEVSAAMMNTKIDRIEASGADVVVGVDVSCLMHIGGGLRRRGSSVVTKHIAENLAGWTRVTVPGTGFSEAFAEGCRSPSIVAPGVITTAGLRAAAAFPQMEEMRDRARRIRAEVIAELDVHLRRFADSVSAQRRQRVLRCRRRRGQRVHRQPGQGGGSDPGGESQVDAHRGDPPQRRPRCGRSRGRRDRPRRVHRAAGWRDARRT